MKERDQRVVEVEDLLEQTKTQMKESPKVTEDPKQSQEQKKGKKIFGKPQ
jgi:hypothetical protein